MKTTFLICLFLISVNTIAQVGDTRADMDVVYNDLSNTYNKGKNLRIHDKVEGSPFLKDEWEVGSVTLINGKTYERIKVKLDIFSNEVHYISPVTGQDMGTISGTIKELTFQPSDSKTISRFRIGYPAVDSYDTLTFYKVLAEGKVQLLQLIQKEIANTDEYDKKRKFIQREDYYFYSQQKIVRAKNKDSIIKLFPEHEEKITQYIKVNELKAKTELNLQRIVAFCNTL